jgi:molybdopterin synthase sulfur carrier subunit
MKVTFEFLGVLQRLAGSSELALILPAVSCTVGDAIEALEQRQPDLRESLARCACAVGDAIVHRRDPLVAGTRLALLPPVAGG